MDLAMLFTKLLVSLINTYNSANSLASRLTGFSLRDGLKRNSGDSDFKRCAHRYKIFLRHDLNMMDSFMAFSDKNFALLHQRWEDPAMAILEDDRATLFGLTRTHAMFAVVKKGVDVYDTAEGPFVYANQLRLAYELVTVPLRHFARLAEMAPDLEKSVRVLLLSSTGRCGSTLLTKMLEGLGGRVLSMSEPDFINHICHWGKEMSEPADDLLRAGLRLQVNKKETVRDGVRLVVVKTRSVNVSLIPNVSRASPYVRHAFMYRNPRSNIASQISMFREFHKVANLEDDPEVPRLFGARMEPMILSGVENEAALKNARSLPSGE